MIPAKLYANLCPEIKQELNLQRLAHLEWIRDWDPEVARVASERVTDTYAKHPELSLPRSILEAYTVLAICYNSGETELTEYQFENIKSILNRYGVFKE
jgi:hypothetical protein